MKKHGEFLQFFAVGIVVFIVYELFRTGALSSSTVTVPSPATPASLTPGNLVSNFTSFLGNFFNSSGQGSSAGLNSYIQSLPSTPSGAQIIPYSDPTSNAAAASNPNYAGGGGVTTDGSVATNALGDLFSD